VCKSMLTLRGRSIVCVSYSRDPHTQDVNSVHIVTCEPAAACSQSPTWIPTNVNLAKTEGSSDRHTSSLLVVPTPLVLRCPHLLSRDQKDLEEDGHPILALSKGHTHPSARLDSPQPLHPSNPQDLEWVKGQREDPHSALANTSV
jgi:hypothetical protein